MSDIFWCKTCLNMSTRPRVTFNDKWTNKELFNKTNKGWEPNFKII